MTDPPFPRIPLRQLVFPITLSLALSLPAVLSGFIMDDLVFLSPMYQPEMPFGYYHYIDEMRRLDILPWWASEDLEINFFRVLSSATLYLDFHLGAARPLPAHLHTALWFVVQLVGAAHLIGLLTRSPRRRKWTFLIFALASTHTFAAGFIAARHALMGSTFAVWAAVLYLVWHRGREKKWFLGTMLLFFLGLLSGESALAFAGFALAHDLFFMEGSLKERLMTFSPVGLAAGAYVLCYKSMGFGPVGSGMYTNPMSAPLEFLAAAPGKVLSMIGAFTLGMPAQIRLAEGLETAPVVVGALCLPLVISVVLLAWKHLEGPERSVLKWSLIMGLFTMLPGLSGITSGRAVTLSGVAFSLIVGIALTTIRFEALSKRRKLLAWPLAGLLFWGLLVMAPLSRMAQSRFMIGVGSTLTTRLGQSELPCDGDAAIYVVNGEFLTPYYAPFVAARFPGQFKGHWRQLVSTISDVTLERTGAETLALSHRGESLLGPMDFALFADPATALPEGAVIEREGLRVRVEARSRKGPTRLSFRIPNLGDPREVCLVTIDRYTFRPVHLPKVGERVVIPYRRPEL